MNDPGGTIYVIVLGPARPLMYPDQISRFIPMTHEINTNSQKFYLKNLVFRIKGLYENFMLQKF